jgi:hypothetical protein
LSARLQQAAKLSASIELVYGISEADILQMSQTNPAKLLGLKP